MRVKIRHTTEYTYDQPPTHGLQQLRMIPKASAGQTIVSWRTEVQGGHEAVAFTDQHNNQVELLTLDPGTRSVTIVCEGEVDTADTVGIIGQHGGFAPLWYYPADDVAHPARSAGAAAGAGPRQGVATMTRRVCTHCRP